MNMDMPGFYVVRMPHRGMGTRLMIESRCFPTEKISPDIPRDWIKRQADNWCDFVKSQHPKDDVFVIERFAEDQK